MASVGSGNAMLVDRQDNAIVEGSLVPSIHHHEMDFHIVGGRKPQTAHDGSDPAAGSSAGKLELKSAVVRVAALEYNAGILNAEIETLECQAKRLLAERDAAMRGQVAEREKAQVLVIEALTRTLEAVERAATAEALIRQIRILPGVRGWLVCRLARKVLDHRKPLQRQADPQCLDGAKYV